MRIIVDTSVVIASGYTMGTVDFIMLFDSLARLGHSLYFPEIVYDELIVKNTEEIEAKAKEIKSSIGRIIKISGAKINDHYFLNDLGPVLAAYREMLDNLVKTEKIRILPYPTRSHKHVADRALRRHRPFDAKGHNGYRDTLIWETVIEAAMSKSDRRPIAFISANTNDFCEAGRPDALHPHLLADITSVKARRGVSITYYSSLDAFVKTHIASSLEQLNAIRDQIANGEYQGLRLEKYAKSLLDEMFATNFILKIKNLRSRLGFPMFVRDIEVHPNENSKNVRITSVDDVRKLSDKEIVIDFSLTCIFIVNYYIDKEDIPSLPERFSGGDFLDLDINISGSLYMGTVLADTRMKIRLVFELESKDVRSWAILDIRADSFGL